jgi:hypothetical protein
MSSPENQRSSRTGIHLLSDSSVHLPASAFRTPALLNSDLVRCRTLVIGTGTGALPIMEELKKEARRRRIKVLVLPTAKAIEVLKENPPETNAILHVTC